MGKILQWWEEYFKKLLNIEKEEGERERNENDQEETRTQRSVIRDDEEVSTPTCEEIEKCIQKNNNKAPGEDSIIAELIKYGGKGIINAMHKLIIMIWITEAMPQS
jgi:hypothetical protein